MNRYLAALSICCTLIVRLALADDKTVTYVDLKGKFNYKHGEKIAEDDREGNFLTVPKGEQVTADTRLKVLLLLRPHCSGHHRPAFPRNERECTHMNRCTACGMLAVLAAN